MSTCTSSTLHTRSDRRPAFRQVPSPLRTALCLFHSLRLTLSALWTADKSPCSADDFGLPSGSISHYAGTKPLDTSDLPIRRARSVYSGTFVPPVTRSASPQPHRRNTYPSRLYRPFFALATVQLVTLTCVALSTGRASSTFAHVFISVRRSSFGALPEISARDFAPVSSAQSADPNPVLQPRFHLVLLDTLQVTCPQSAELKERTRAQSKRTRHTRGSVSAQCRDHAHGLRRQRLVA